MKKTPSNSPTKKSRGRAEKLQGEEDGKGLDAQQKETRPPPDYEPEFYGQFKESLDHATPEEQAWCLGEIFGRGVESPPPLASDLASRWRTALSWKRKREHMDAAMQRVEFMQTRPAGVHDDPFRDDPKRRNLCDMERMVLKGILFDLRIGIYDDERLAPWAADHRFRMGNSVECVGGELWALGQQLWNREQIEKVLLPKMGEFEQRIFKRGGIKFKADVEKYAGRIILKAMADHDAGTFKEIAKFIGLLKKGEARKYKPKRVAGRGWHPTNIKTSLPVALDRVLCRRCPSLARAGGQAFTPRRITREELNEAVEDAQLEAGAHSGKVDSSELSKWIKRLGLRDFMPPDARGAPRKGGK